MRKHRNVIRRANTYTNKNCRVRRFGHNDDPNGMHMHISLISDIDTEDFSQTYFSSTNTTGILLVLVIAERSPFCTHINNSRRIMYIKLIILITIPETVYQTNKNIMHSRPLTSNRTFSNQCCQGQNTLTQCNKFSKWWQAFYCLMTEIHANRLLCSGNEYKQHKLDKVPIIVARIVLVFKGSKCFAFRYNRCKEYTPITNYQATFWTYHVPRMVIFNKWGIWMLTTIQRCSLRTVNIK